MTTVPPPSTPRRRVRTGPTALAPGPVVVIVQPPAAIAALPPATLLEAIVIAPTTTSTAAERPQPVNKSTVTLRTTAGDVTVRLPVQIPDNARVALEILRTATAQNAPAEAGARQQVAQQVTARLVSIDGQPAAQVLAQLHAPGR